MLPYIMNNNLIFAGILLCIQETVAGKTRCGSRAFLSTSVPEDGAGEPGVRISAAPTFF